MRNVFTSNNYLSGNDVKLLKSGEEYFSALLTLIRNAEHRIHLHVYIFENDNTGKEVADTLMNAAKRGVKIYLLVDAFGSKDLPKELIQKMIAEGIHFRKYSPLSTFIVPFRRRMHSKVLIADDDQAIVGGINIADKYRGTEKELPWLDFAILVKGNACTPIAHYCRNIFGRKFFKKGKTYPDPLKDHGNRPISAHMSINDWLRRKNEIYNGYRSAFNEAHESITIFASYFFPGSRMRNRLKRASKRGVKIRLIVPGTSDIGLMKKAINYWYPFLIRNNIRVFEWNESVLHAKIAVVDNKWASIGSYNLNHMSHYSSVEMNMEVLDESFGHSVSGYLEPIIAEKCTEITNTVYWKRKNTLDRLNDWLSYNIIRFLMRLMFFLTSTD